MIKQNVNFSMFLDSFSDTYRHNFTYEGKRALFDYLEQLSEDLGEYIELDIVALCRDYTEYKNLEELQRDYSNIKTMEDLENKTQVIRFEERDKYDDSDAFIIQKF